MTDLVNDMPPFLRAPVNLELRAKIQAEHDYKTSVHRGSLIKMPEMPKYQLRPKVQKINVLDKRNGKKQKKASYPTTEAIKIYLGDRKGDARKQECYAIARENGIDFQKWKSLNTGQVAMNLSNVIRGKYYKKEVVWIGGHEVTNEYLEKVLGKCDES
tara:strand:+ start:1079 stop:1552 length:474 start_codon:yes stop_codon:yes gene_type:complete